MRRPLVLAATALALAGCDVIEQPSGLVARPTMAWREIATDEDRTRLRAWRETFVDALDRARRAGHSAAIAREGALLEPDSAIGGPIPNGRYRCRVIKLGARTEGMPDFVAYPAFACEVRAERALQRLAKLSGSQRQVGLIFPNDPLRQVFLGTLVLGDESRALQYGQDSARNIIGFVERIGDKRWRLVMPRPHFESRLDVMELVPA